MNDEIKVGDIVWLRSGGPAMTVDNKFENEVICVWFEGTKITCYPFRPHSLTKTEPNPPTRA